MHRYAQDAFAGFVAFVTSIPQCLAYARICGYAPARGLSTAGLPLVMFGMVTGTAWLNVGVTSITARLAEVDLGLSSEAKEDEEAYAQVMAAYAITVGVASLLLGAAGAGRLMSHVPVAVTAGFEWGFAAVVLQSQLKDILLSESKHQLPMIVQASSLAPLIAAFPAGGRDLSKLCLLVVSVSEWCLAPLLFGSATLLIVMVIAKRTLPASFPAGSSIIVATLLMTTASAFWTHSAATVGIIDAGPASRVSLFGLFDVTLPLHDPRMLPWSFLATTLGGWHQVAIKSIMFALVDFLQIISVCSMFESSNGIAWSPQRELFAQGVGCVAAGVSGAAPIGGSLSRSLLMKKSGAVSSVAAVMNGLCFIFLLPAAAVLECTPIACLVGAHAPCIQVLSVGYTGCDCDQCGREEGLASY